MFLWLMISWFGRLKSQDKTFSNRSGRESELDYAIASDDLSFDTNSLPDANNNPFEIEIFGWNKKSGNARISFIDNISDHCALFGTVT